MGAAVTVSCRVCWNRDVDAETTPDADAALLGDALGIPVEEIHPLSREPLGDGTVAGFELHKSHGTHGPDGLDRPDTAGLPDGTVAYVDTSRVSVARETGLVLPDVARVWVHPADPHLPALAPAAYGEAAGLLLSRLGLAEPQPPQIVGYRPGRRAVLKVDTAGGTVWVKVVRPRRIERVVAAHTRLREHGLPVPGVLGWSPEGLLVLASAEGTAATSAPWHPAALIDALDDLRDRLSAVPLDWPARTSLAERLPWYLGRLRPLLPTHAERLDGLDRAVTAALAHRAFTDETIHGDLHLGQLFLDGPRISGLIDVDTAGRGARGEDAAAFIAHAVASALLTARQGGDDARVWALAAEAEQRWATEPRTRALTAVHLLGHALGAASVRDATRTEALLRHAERVATEPKSPLIEGFDEA
jgi:aminoglycoside phosphotransferase